MSGSGLAVVSISTQFPLETFAPAGRWFSENRNDYHLVMRFKDKTNGACPLHLFCFGSDFGPYFSRRAMRFSIQCNPLEAI
jgi:hypothetical protein